MAVNRNVSLLILGSALAFAVPVGAQTVDTPVEPQPPAEVAAPAPAPTPEPTPEPMLAPDSVRRKSRFRIGPELNYFLPSSSKTRDRFGSSWFGVGVGFGSVRRTAAHGELGAEVFLLNNSQDDADAWIVPVGVAYRHPIGGGLGGGRAAGRQHGRPDDGADDRGDQDTGASP